MKFRLMSDLHLEFQDKVLDFTPTPLQEDFDTVLILAGDIGVGTDAKSFIEKMCKQFYKVVYCLGNHEFYHKEYNKVRKQWRAMEMPENFVFLDDDVAFIENVRLVGGTLWTDFDGDNWFAKQRAQDSMNDYHCIKFKEGNKHSGYRKRKFNPMDAVRAHKQTLFTITEAVREKHDGPTIVVTHHLPHPLCIHDTFKGNALNPAYVTNLDMYIEEYDIDVWCHGHTHNNVDVEVHNTRILCNPRGYVPHEVNDEFDEKFTFTL